MIKNIAKNIAKKFGKKSAKSFRKTAPKFEPSPRGKDWVRLPGGKGKLVNSPRNYAGKDIKNWVYAGVYGVPAAYVGYQMLKGKGKKKKKDATDWMTKESGGSVYNHKGMRVPGMMQDGGALPKASMGKIIKAINSATQKSRLNSRLFSKQTNHSKAANKKTKLHKKLR